MTGKVLNFVLIDNLIAFYRACHNNNEVFP
jgi:hypothetical protein